MLLILREALLGVKRFEEFMDRLPINRAALSSRLKMLTEAGLLDRVPPTGRKAHYRLTPAGLELAPVYKSIADWAGAHLFAADEAPPTYEM